MSNPYDIYQKARSQRLECEKWAALIGRQSNTTAPHLGKITEAECRFTIHFQPYDGANNYHDAPKPLTEALAEVVKEHASLLIKDALQLLIKKESDALVACKEFANGIIAQITDIEKINNDQD